MEEVGKHGMLSLKEAAVNFFLSTALYFYVIFFRELYSWISGKPFNEILTIKSYYALVFFASLIYFGSLVSLGYLAIRSYKRYKNKL